jgi:hypothetical protein
LSGLTPEQAAALEGDLMKHVVLAMVSITFLGVGGFAQSTFEVTATPVPLALLKQNYGKTPKGITGYELSICNSSRAQQSVVSSEIYQAMSKSNPAIQPLGRQMVLGSILRAQNWGALRILGIVLNSASNVLMVLSSSKYGGSQRVLAAIALGSLSAQELTVGQKTNMSADQLEKFETQVLEPALVVDSGSCVERTVFTATQDSKEFRVKPASLSFHVR